MCRALLFLMVLACWGCRTTSPGPLEPRARGAEFSQQPDLRPFARAGFFWLSQSLVVRVNEGADSLVVPSGFVTDFASIPRRLEGVVSRLGPHLRPAIVHDYLYWEQVCTRSQADAIFLEMMADAGVSWTTRRIMYWSVRWRGGGPWRLNRDHRSSGEPRVIPPEERNFHAEATWSQVRDYLEEVNGHSSQEPTITPGFCTYPKAKRYAGRRP